MDGRTVYLDYNATTPVDPTVVDAMIPHLRTGFGNPSSAHAYGAPAHRALAAAREQIGAFLHAHGDHRIVFTGSGSEADALAIRGAVLPQLSHGRRAHVITQATEHPAVLAACAYLRDLHGVAVTVLPVDHHGRVDPQDVAQAVTTNTVLITVMHANNETGTIQPIAEIARIARDAGVLMHCDAAQSAGKIDVDVDALGVDLLTVVGHKMYAPKGIAALYVRDRVSLRPLVDGGGQEGGLRAGTENVAFAVGLGTAAQQCDEALRTGESGRLRQLRDELADHLQRRLPGRTHLHGHPTERLPNTLNVGIDGVRALGVLDELDGVAASAGSACHAGHDAPSPVLSAMNLPAPQALSALRLSLGRWTTSEDVSTAATLIAHTIDGTTLEMIDP